MQCLVCSRMFFDTISGWFALVKVIFTANAQTVHMSSSIGYGPSALTGNAPAPQAAFNAIPVFNGRAGDFDRFKFKVKHASQHRETPVIMATAIHGDFLYLSTTGARFAMP